MPNGASSPMGRWASRAIASSRSAKERTSSPRRPPAGSSMAVASSCRPASLTGIWRWSVPLYELQSAAEQCLAAELSAVSMLRSGTTCFLEAGTILALDPVFEALRASGIRGRVGRWVLDRAFSADADQTVLTDRALRLLAAELCRHPGRADPLRVWPPPT